MPGLERVSFWVTAVATCCACGLVAAAVPAVAGSVSGLAVRELSNPAGFELLVPSAWRTPPQTLDARATPASVKQALVSPDGKETLRVSVAAQTIHSEDIALFVSVFLGNVVGIGTDLGQPRSVDVPGAVSASVQAARYGDSSGSRLAETVLAAATGTQLYVLDIVVPDGFAGENGGLIEAIVGSFQIVGPTGPYP